MWLLKNSTFILLQLCQNKVSFQSKGPSVALIIVKFSKGLGVLSIDNRALSTL